MKTLSRSTWKTASRILVLGAYAALLSLGRLGFWAIAFVVGLLSEAVKPGRFYCMRLCPIRAFHDLAGGGSGTKSKNRVPSRGRRSIRTLGRAFITAFLILFGISLVLGIRGRLFPAFVAIGILLSFALSLQTICSSFCPMGSAFVLIRRISSRISSLTATPAPARSSKGE